jgi:hypothetical protein
MKIHQLLFQIIHMIVMTTSPSDLFGKQKNLYSLFDKDGMPTHDASGKELSKSTLAKLKKDWAKQEKLYSASTLSN